jgi:hypothetical protein
MKRLFPGAFLICLAALCLAACAGPEKAPTQDNPQAAVAEPAPVAPFSEPGELSITGELKDVDLQARTFVLRDPAGTERTFSFSDETDVAGESGIQGLSSKQNGPAKVVYTKVGDVNHAVHIEIAAQ